MQYLTRTNWPKLTFWILSFGLLILFVACARQGTPDVPAESTPSVEPTVIPPTQEPTAMPEPTPTDEPTTADSPIDESLVSAPMPVELVNPGFEEQDANGRPTGWENTGDVDVVMLEGNGRSGELRLTHKSDAAYEIETHQTVSGLDNGWYTLRTWIRSSGGQNDAWIGLTCGGEEERAYIPSTSPGYRWLQLVVSNEVTDGECTISLYSDGTPDSWASFDDVELVPGRAALTMLGADISSLAKSEDLGGIYRETDGTPGDALQILKDHGLNWARLRVWVDPADGYNSKETVLAMAQRLHEKDIKLLVDFHYSDNWADPGKQIKPAAWTDLDFPDLVTALYDHTFDVCSALVAQGTPPDMVQVGNEINAGLLWPDADYQNFDNMAELLTAGYQAVKDCSPDTPVMLHIAEGGDNELAKWWFGNITRRDVPYDVIGISYYPFWHGSLGELQTNLNDITERYGKDVVLVETAYAFTNEDKDDYANIAESAMATPGYPFTPEGQRRLLRDVMAVVRAVPNGRGLGVFYWDAVWTAVEGNGWDGSDPSTGNAWENQALFDFDDIVLPALDEYLSP